MRVFTVGHSTHSLDELHALLAEHDVGRVADVRCVPRSARHPQFRAEALAAELPKRGVEHRHMPVLGGLRRPLADSPNGGWDNDALRGYADYALTEDFAEALDELQALAGDRPTAIMCSEGLWWRCHRRLIADRLVACGWTVCHIGPDGRLTEHELPSVRRAPGRRDGALSARAGVPPDLNDHLPRFGGRGAAEMLRRSSLPSCASADSRCIAETRKQWDRAEAPAGGVTGASSTSGVWPGASVASEPLLRVYAAACSRRRRCRTAAAPSAIRQALMAAAAPTAAEPQSKSDDDEVAAAWGCRTGCGFAGTLDVAGGTVPWYAPAGKTYTSALGGAPPLCESPRDPVIVDSPAYHDVGLVARISRNRHRGTGKDGCAEDCRERGCDGAHEHTR